MSSNFGKILPLTAELAALRVLKLMYNVVSTLASSFLLYLLILAGNEDNYKISNEFEIQPDFTTYCGVILGEIL